MKQKLNYIILIMISVFFYSCNKNDLKIKTGDFIFQDLNCGELCDAIENSTTGYKDIRISHVGIVVKEKKQIFVIEAYDGVSKTPLSIFLDRSKTDHGVPKVFVGRLKKQYQRFIPDAIKKVKTLIGKPYDDNYKLYNDKFYCSELIYETFLDENNKSIFPIKKMTFVNKHTGKTDIAWIDFFKNLGIAIPEGELGSNPANYSTSNKINILDIAF